MENKLILHIGTGKTGTTALQSFLWKNATKLRECGWDYPDILKIWCRKNDRRYIEGEKNGNLLKVSIIADWKEEKKIELWSIILERLKQYNVIISDESIWGHPAIDTKAAIEDYKRRYANIKVVIYLRRQDQYLESLWNQNVKDRLETDDLWNFINRPRNRQSADYLGKIKSIEKVVGRDNIIVRVYEDGQFKGTRGDITSDFIQVLNKIEGEMKDEWEGIWLPGNENRKLAGEMLWMKLLFNRAYVSAFPDIDMEAEMKNGFANIDTDFARFFQDTENSNIGASSLFMNEDERRKILKKYDADNKEIAHTYLGRDDGRLFLNDIVNMNVYHPDFSKREEKIIRIFARMISEFCR